MLKVEIKTDNAAFSDNSNAELARILRELAKRIENGEQHGRLRDLNGNKVGQFDNWN